MDHRRARSLRDVALPAEVVWIGGNFPSGFVGQTGVVRNRLRIVAQDAHGLGAVMPNGDQPIAAGQLLRGKAVAAQFLAQRQPTAVGLNLPGAKRQAQHIQGGSGRVERRVLDPARAIRDGVDRAGAADQVVFAGGAKNVRQPGQNFQPAKDGAEPDQFGPLARRDLPAVDVVLDHPAVVEVGQSILPRVPGRNHAVPVWTADERNTGPGWLPRRAGSIRRSAPGIRHWRVRH